MKRFWWVNHKQTVSQEISGQYLWSPKREANARSQFYDNMRIASPGDQVLSYANGRIRHAGVVSDYALSAPKPSEFGAVGAYWDDEGWLLPMHWHLAATPFLPKEALAEIAPLLPRKYSPISADTGNGNQKAYLSEIDPGIFHIIFPRLHIGSAANEPATIDFGVVLDDAVETSIVTDPNLDKTVKDQLVKARQGQGIFRNRLSCLEKRCRVTGLDNPALLIASHIKPWRSCCSSAERLDGNNGLLLAPHVDLLFDRGFVSFGDEGDVMVSSRLLKMDIERLGLKDNLSKNIGPFSIKQRAYLSHHRRIVFLG